MLLSKDVALFEGIMAMAMLVFLQFAITWLSVRYGSVNGMIKSEPTLLVHRGALLNGALQAQRVTPAEILSVLRGQGVGRIEEAEAVVLETDGSFSVVTGRAGGSGSSALADVPGAMSADGRACAG